MKKLSETLEEKVKNFEALIQKGNGESEEEVQAEEVQEISVVPEFAVSLQEAHSRINLLKQFVKEYLIHGQDYGLIPNCNKPSLFKPGAEKLCDVFGFSKHVDVINRTEDWDKPFLNYEIKVTLISKRSGQIEAEGIGSANSREKKFKSQDTYSIANSLLKIAKKRALVDAVLSATRSSGLFTQDVEDILIYGTDERATREQLKEIYEVVEQKNIPAKVIKNHIMQEFQISNSKELTKKQAMQLLDWLKK